MNEEDQARENFAVWLGNKPQREVIAAILAAPFIFHNAADGEKGKRDIRGAVLWADYLIKYCKEHPPA